MRSALTALLKIPPLQLKFVNTNYIYKVEFEARQKFPRNKIRIHKFEGLS